LLRLNRSSYYLEPAEEIAHNLKLMNLIDEEYTAHPFYGSRRMTAWLCGKGYIVNRKRVQRLMHFMGLAAIYPKPKLSKADAGHKKYPYLLRGVEASFPGHIWSTDIIPKQLQELVFLLRESPGVERSKMGPYWNIGPF